MNIIRKKGSDLPIKILIKINIENNEPSIKYYLGEKLVTFQNIQKFLYEVKNIYINELNSMYKNNISVRFLYGKIFKNIIKHINIGTNIEPLSRYILNITDNNIKINDGQNVLVKNSIDYIFNYLECIKDSFKNIDNYIVSLFSQNKQTIKTHYEHMKLLNSKDKGIYLYECENISKEELILNLFLKKINQLPIAQNILITNKETSYEELQAFLYRAILCEYPTLFVIEINESFSEYQQQIMWNYIDKLLRLKKIDYISKSNKEQYIDVCLAIIYDKKYRNNYGFLNELEKINIKKINIDKIEQNSYKSYFENINIITSDFCGLGKSYKIKRKIMDNNKEYYHLLIGGVLTKNIIFNKLQNSLTKIRKKDYKNMSVHLDLSETKDIEIMNEFLFSLLISKFYLNDGDIIYIPKDISFYIEVPNCFKNYCSRFSLLNIFNRENITFNNMPRFDFSDDIINNFNAILGIDSNKKLQEFVKENIGIEKYSYYQINIFIKLFISRYSHFNSKLKFVQNNKDDINSCIQKFAEYTKCFTNSGFSQLLMRKDKNNDNNLIDELKEEYEYNLKNENSYCPLLFAEKEKIAIDKLYFNEINSENCKNTYDYLKKLKDLFNLKNEVDKDNGELRSLSSILKDNGFNYLITKDNFIKMVLMFYRLKADIPVILMGETGCGKTSLIKKFNQLLNNGLLTLHTININPGITNENIFEFMKEKNQYAKEHKNEKIWIFFDEINNCSSLSQIAELFVNKNLNGNILSDNIRFIGACTPYRIKKEKEYYEIILDEVQVLPESILNCIQSCFSISDMDKKEYIYNMTEKLFTEEEEDLHKITTEAISKCHIFLRKNLYQNEVSLRDISRLVKLIEFFEKYFTIKNNFLERINNERNNKIRSIICSIYLLYYIKITDEFQRNCLEIELKETLLQLINKEKSIIDNDKNILERIENKDLNDEIIRNSEIIINFSDFINIEKEFLINQIELNKEIYKINILKQNIFLLFLSICTHIPLFIKGQTGIGKSIAVQTIINAMKGKYSTNNFFKYFPEIIPTYFKGLESTTLYDIEKLFKVAEEKYSKLKQNKEKSIISLIIFDELGLAQQSKSNPLKILHSKLEYIESKTELSFIGISNYSLDAEKINRALVLSLPNIDYKIDELIEISKSIVENLNSEIKNDCIINIISKTYYSYKQTLKKLKEFIVLKKYSELKNIKIIGKSHYKTIKNDNDFIELMKKENSIKIDFHGIIDFYYLIKGIVNDLEKLEVYRDSDLVKIINKHIERNFGGIEYEINTSFDSLFDNIKEEDTLIKATKSLFEEYNLWGKNKIIKINSVFLFKMLYNRQCESDNDLQLYRNLYINKSKIDAYNINRCIHDNILDNNSRYLLLQIKPSLNDLISQSIRNQIPEKNIITYERSPFINDNNKDYRLNKINEIIDFFKDDKLIILQNFEELNPLLFDLMNIKFIEIGRNKFARICLDNFNEQAIPVNDEFRIIIIVDKKIIDRQNLAFLNRLEKMQINFDCLLDNSKKEIAKSIIDEINLEYNIESYHKLNYSINDLLINCYREEILGQIYNYLSKCNTNKSKKDINDMELKEYIINKIYKILPQDIIAILPVNNIIKEAYLSKNIYNLKDFLNTEESKEFKISIIYTFTSILNIVENINSEVSFKISDINSENRLKEAIDEIKHNIEGKVSNDKYIFIHFEQSDSKILNFTCNYLLQNYKSDNYNYIIILHIHRNFEQEKHKEKIFSKSDIFDDIYHIFIDNLNYTKEIYFEDLMTIKIKDILLKYRKELELDNEFKKTLNNFIYNELNENKAFVDNYEKYINEIMSYIEKENSIKEKIFESVYKLIEGENYINYKDIIEKIYTSNMINKYTIDIASCIIEFIKEELFNKNLTKVFHYLEDNNILTTLLGIDKEHNRFLTKNQVNLILDETLNEMIINIHKNKVYKSKFLINYNVPGFYNFFVFISDYIKNAISSKYFANENKIRELHEECADEIKRIKYENEENILNNLYDEVYFNHQYIMKMIDYVPIDLILKDYITFYLQKYYNSGNKYKIDDIYHNIIEIMLIKRFDNDNKIIQNNKSIYILLLKIIWIESYAYYILDVLKIIEKVKMIFGDFENIIYIALKDFIFKKKVVFIIDEKRNQEHTKEVNECFYLLLASICYYITSNRIQIIENINDNNKICNNKIKIEINYYYNILKNINELLQTLAKKLNLHLNEIYIIDEFIKIIELFKKYKNKVKIITIAKYYLIENALIIQKYSINNDKTKLVEALINNFDKLYTLIINDKELIKDRLYYDNLKYIFLKEIKKVSDINYRFHILNKLLQDNEIIIISGDILELIFQNYLKNDENYDTIDKLFGEKNILLETLEENLKKNNFILENTLLNVFEKNCLKYLMEIFTNNVNDMSCMFSRCSSLTNINLSNFNTNNVKFI